MKIDLRTDYGGLSLNSPLIIGACPMTAEELMRANFARNGAGAIVLPSLFEDQVNEWNRENGFESTPSDSRGSKSSTRENDHTIANAASYLSLFRHAAENKSVPLIASLNGRFSCNWANIAKQLEESGADAIELNVGRLFAYEFSDSRDVEEGIVNAAESIRAEISIPLFLKLGRHYTSLSHLARRLDSKADGIVLFSHAPELDISTENLQLTTLWGLTEPGSISKSIECIIRVKAFCPEMPIAASGGIGTSDDFAKALLAGADAAMITSAVYRDGPEIVRTFLDGLSIFMERHSIASMEDLNAIRPKLFDAKSELPEYAKALSSPPDPTQIRSAGRVLQCDRWGHIRHESQ